MTQEERNRGAAFYYHEQFGFERLPGVAGGDEVSRKKICENYAKALCVAVAGDGEASPLEVQWIKGLLSVKGYPTDLVDSVDGMVPPKSGFEDTSTTRNFGNNLNTSDGKVPCNPFEFNTMASYVCGLFVLLSSSSSLCSEQGVSKDEYH